MFPKRRQTNIDIQVEHLVIGMVGGVFAGIAWRFSRILAVLLCCPLVIAFGEDIGCSLLNRWRELQWSRAFQRRVHPHRVAGLVAANPNRYVLHARFFRQISRGQSVPICMIEDLESNQLIPVYPCSWRAVHACQQAGLKVVKH